MNEKAVQPIRSSNKKGFQFPFRSPLPSHPPSNTLLWETTAVVTKNPKCFNAKFVWVKRYLFSIRHLSCMGERTYSIRHLSKFIYSLYQASHKALDVNPKLTPCTFVQKGVKNICFYESNGMNAIRPGKVQPSEKYTSTVQLFKSWEKYTQPTHSKF